MSVWTTLQLISLPRVGWPRLSAALAQNQNLPTPINYAAGIGALSVVVTFASLFAKSGLTNEKVTVAILSTILGYIGCASLVVLALPFFFRALKCDQKQAAYYGSFAAMPMLASGVFHLVVREDIFFAIIIAASFITFRSSIVGAEAMLGLKGKSRVKAAIITTALACLPIWLTSLYSLGF